ncbi:MAG: hypothetical protein IT352_07480 [Gemmatimonadales bacterium]|nr:hypothetical protein [Gemmatimonadales bacterium]
MLILGSRRRSRPVITGSGSSYVTTMAEDWDFPNDAAMQATYGIGGTTAGTRVFLNAPSGGTGYTGAGFASAYDAYTLVSTARWPKACLMIQPWTDLYPSLSVTGSTTGPTGAVRFNLPSSMADIWVRRWFYFTLLGDTINGQATLTDWTTVGTTPATSNAHKMTADLYDGGTGLASTQRRTEIASTDDWNMSDEHSGSEWDETYPLSIGGSGASLDTAVAPTSGGLWSGHIEHVMLYRRTSTSSSIHGTWLRVPYDRNNNPTGDSWRARVREKTALSTAVSPLGLLYVQNGLNRNRSNDAGTMGQVYGPVEIVDGSVYSNPFDVPLW